jgi:type II secretory pathway predicted ATPase ExeA
MKSIVEQYNACRLLEMEESDTPSIPVLGRLSRAPVKRLARAYRDRRSLALLVSQSRFSPGYVLDRFLAAVDAETAVIRVDRAFDDPASFMDHVICAIGFDSRSAGLSELDQAFRLFLRYQDTHRQRTVLALPDIDAHGPKVLAAVREMIDRQAATDVGLMVVATGPTNDSLEPMDPALEAISELAAERIVLTPFVLSETREFISNRFEHRPGNGSGNGKGGRRFEVYATQLVHELTEGVPETVDLLCRMSLEIAADDDDKVISTSDVKMAAGLIGLLSTVAGDQPDASDSAHAVSCDSPGQLIVKVQGQPEKKIGINGSHVLIGRDRLCDICVVDSQVSRLHGLIARAAQGVYYLDLGSTNGSAINGEAAERLPLTNNDVIAVGDVRIIYTSKGAAESQDPDLDATDTFEIPNYDEPSSTTHVASATGMRREP